MKIAIKLLLAIMIFTTALNANDTTASAIINKMINAYGGQENLKQLNEYEQTWDIEAKTNNKNGTDNRKVKMPSYLYTKLQYPHKTETRELTNNSGTKQFGDRVVKAQGPMLDAMKLQLMRLFHPLELQKHLKNIVAIPNNEHYLLSLSQNGVAADYYVSKKNYLIQKVIGKLKMGSHKMEFLTLYEEYKNINGVMLPHREVKYAGSVNTAIMRLKKIKFAKPSSGFVQFKI